MKLCKFDSFSDLTNINRKNGLIFNHKSLRNFRVKLFNLTITEKSTVSRKMAKFLIVSREIHHLITTLFIDPTYLDQRMKGSQKVEELKL